MWYGLTLGLTYYRGRYHPHNIAPKTVDCAQHIILPVPESRIRHTNIRLSRRLKTLLCVVEGTLRPAKVFLVLRCAGCWVGSLILIRVFGESVSFNEVLGIRVLSALLSLRRGPYVLTQIAIIAAADSTWLQQCSNTMVPILSQLSNQRRVLEYQRERSSC